MQSLSPVKLQVPRSAIKAGERAEFANLLRGLAALSVLVAHYYGVFWLARDAVAGFINAPSLDIHQHPVPRYVRLLNGGSFFSFGSFGVALFFLISGFVIPFSLSKSTGVSFLLGRFFRIVPTYAVGFTVTLAALWLACAYFGKPWPYSASELAIHYVPGLRDLLGSRNIDGIIWTLEVEMKFYVISAVALALFRKGSCAVFGVPVAIAIASSIAMAVLPTLAASQAWLRLPLYAFVISATYLIYMFIGVSIHCVHAGKMSLRAGAVAGISLFLLFVLMWWRGPERDQFRLTVNYGAALALFVLAAAFHRSFRSWPLFDFFADISYPLYVTHGMLGYVMLRILLQQGIGSGLALLIVTTFATGVAWLIHMLVESPSQQFGRRVSDAFTRRTARSRLRSASR